MPVLTATRTSPGKHRVLTRADLHWGELEQFYAASWILTSVWALLCAVGCKGFSDSALDTAIPCQSTSPFSTVLWTVVKSHKCWVAILPEFLISQNHQVLPAWALMGTVMQAMDLISDLGWGKHCSSSERLGNFHLFISFINPSFSLLLRAPNHCPGWQPWKPHEIWESKWHTLTNSHGIPIYLTTFSLKLSVFSTANCKIQSPSFWAHTEKKRFFLSK